MRFRSKRSEGKLIALSATDGKQLAEHELSAPPVFDGMAAAGDRLFTVTMDGRVVCHAAA